MQRRIRKTRRHQKRALERVTTGQVNRVRRYFNQAHAFRYPLEEKLREVFDDLRGYPGTCGPGWEEYHGICHQIDTGFLRLRRQNRVSQALIEKVMRCKGWTREQVNRPIPADA